MDLVSVELDIEMVGNKTACISYTAFINPIDDGKMFIPAKKFIKIRKTNYETEIPVMVEWKDGSVTMSHGNMNGIFKAVAKELGSEVEMGYYRSLRYTPLQ